MSSQFRVKLIFQACATLASSFCAVLLVAKITAAEPLRIAYTSIAVIYGPLWLTEETGLFKKYNIEPEFVYIAGGPPSLQALIAGDVAISFTAAGAGTLYQGR
jgi:ABC-type nitrate/sulfonate/bicarbonate transport system substrate-binding protein